MRENVIRIGRYPENDIVIADKSLSGLHAKLRVCANGFYLLSDAGSTNGTFVMRQGRAHRVSGSERVWPNEEVVLGNCTMRLSDLLSFAPPHLATPPADSSRGGPADDHTQAVDPPPGAFSDRGGLGLPGPQASGGHPVVTPELVAGGVLGAPQQAGVARVAMGSPVPSREEVIWSGYSALAYWVLGMAWSALWVIIWLIVATNAAQWVAQIPDARRELGQALGFVSAPFLFLAFLSALGLLRRILLYLNIYYEFTSQRVRKREGILTLKRNHIELFRLKDFEVVETLWGRLFDYCHIRLISSDRLLPDTLLLAVPNGASLAEEMRKLAQINRAESGIMHLKE